MQTNEQTKAGERTQIWIGTIPDIFGYGMTVATDSEASAIKALKSEYRRWKKQYPNPENTFETSFEAFGGNVRNITPGKVYYDNFGE